MSGSSLAKSSVAGALAAFLLGALLLFVAAPRAEALSVHYRCGSFSAGNGSIYVAAEGITCKLALELQETYWLAPEDEKDLIGPDEYNGYVRLKKFPGWHCTSGALAGGCHKGQLDAGYFDGAPDATSTPCGSLRINYSPLPGEHYGRMYLRAPLSITCGKAKSLLRRYQHHHSGCTDSGCTVAFTDGWTCRTPTPGEWPSVMACEKGLEKVEAHVKSKIKGPR
jgi:hypothetical protein